MKELILAIQFLTRIPLNINIQTEDDSFAKSVLWFPAAGILIGAFGAAAYWLSSQLLEGLFPVICAVFVNVCITGGLHVDGLADTCDGIFSARKRERMLEIMKDSRIGTNGTLAVVFDIILRVGILAAVAPQNLLWLLFAAPIASRALLPLIMKLSVYARAEGMGGLFLGKQTWNRTLTALIAGGAISIMLLRGVGLTAFAAATAVALIFRGYIYSKLQGMTGDTVGATNELAEMAFLLAAAVLWRNLL